jgi:hypothetical protein
MAFLLLYVCLPQKHFFLEEGVFSPAAETPPLSGKMCNNKASPSGLTDEKITAE